MEKTNKMLNGCAYEFYIHAGWRPDYTDCPECINDEGIYSRVHVNFKSASHKDLLSLLENLGTQISHKINAPNKNNGMIYKEKKTLFSNKQIPDYEARAGNIEGTILGCDCENPIDKKSDFITNVVISGELDMSAREIINDLENEEPTNFLYLTLKGDHKDGKQRKTSGSLRIFGLSENIRKITEYLKENPSKYLEIMKSFFPDEENSNIRKNIINKAYNPNRIIFIDSTQEEYKNFDAKKYKWDGEILSWMLQDIGKEDINSRLKSYIINDMKDSLDCKVLK